MGERTSNYVLTVIFYNTNKQNETKNKHISSVWRAFHRFSIPTYQRHTNNHCRGNNCGSYFSNNKKMIMKAIIEKIIGLFYKKPKVKLPKYKIAENQKRLAARKKRKNKKKKK